MIVVARMSEAGQGYLKYYVPVLVGYFDVSSPRNVQGRALHPTASYQLLGGLPGLRPEVAGQEVLFKIDYYDLDLRFHSPNPAGPFVCALRKRASDGGSAVRASCAARTTNGAASGEGPLPHSHGRKLRATGHSRRR